MPPPTTSLGLSAKVLQRRSGDNCSTLNDTRVIAVDQLRLVFSRWVLVLQWMGNWLGAQCSIHYQLAQISLSTARAAL